jgi:hypothetical protein
MRNREFHIDDFYRRGDTSYLLNLDNKILDTKDKISKLKEKIKSRWSTTCPQHVLNGWIEDMERLEDNLKSLKEVREKRLRHRF